MEDTVDLFSDIYVVTLPHRSDRHIMMERLRQSLALNWTYVDAIPSSDPVIMGISEWVGRLRQRVSTLQPQTENQAEQRFEWPDMSAIDGRSRSRQLLETSASPEWPLLSSDARFADRGIPYDYLSPASMKHSPTGTLDSRLQDSPLTCAKEDFVSGPTYTSSLPAYKLLTPAKIACWYSHLRVIQRIANEEDRRISEKGTAQAEDVSREGITLVLEDDIDIERDIRDRLRDVWSASPSEWDIMFLGHCWSNESHYSALPAKLSADRPQYRPRNTLHPSFAPKCTHAYALTRTGARRLLLHLHYPPFAYSRALDQAFSWLVQSGRLRAFSVVPSVIVQRKADESDIDPGRGGTGSSWREYLDDGVLGS
ncbi:uncharacterized protein LAESUDRAFT_647818 [Laetiporus sulphureus 93-53]|uniref:Glycosyltransferase family 25 protein n=1 Tax=Laetiporus sulphureus 93-53 TaxID=1314785 RepID=A0A165FJI2_9APHY|nr:uncharacterized protein LAESUDRAFT_647818 [Laetiporus sulphureus 93-53]KZT09066.1 hypothetical protein LAESUDRAFT_647818 [Laetiporus sulphureus 93-53]